MNSRSEGGTGVLGTGLGAGPRRLLAWLVGLILPVFLVSQGLAQPAVRIITLEEPPTNFLENGQVTGTTVDMVRAMAEYLGEPVEIELLPPAQNTPNTFLFAAGYNAERQRLGYQAIGPVITRSHLLFALSGNTYEISDLEDIRRQGLSVSGVDADWRTAYLQERGIDVQTTTAEHVLNLKKLMVGRTDLWISSDVEAPSVLEDAGIDSGKVKPVFVITTAPSYILASKGTSAGQLARWQAAFDAVSQDANLIGRLQDKWTRKLGTNVEFDKNKGFYFSGPEEDEES
ncbi:transporter substrate-binding domain-containing protein [Roseibium denhamense]|uniref:ABC-type amino acid transport substrate-binding protein n=1 Tax=Roseibium denhamense TaxID=76305 RepID=A0ABY1NDI8_9HYPH|nr:transporter substrate-binding domain-containing protein [Roseibium denhamense]MTI04309.1 transporter substrate-binding domain-containing protein [Roseibium denhamense]SMP07114.1 ABC-type amino acid transport substrate-binding protein [Roseibium denhamense]